MRICILMGSADISGGSLVIFEHALHARSAGHEVVVVTLWPFDRDKLDWHRAIKVLDFRSFEEIAGETFDLVLATFWRTVYELPRVKGRRFAYFVQSIESRFYPERQAALRELADATYTLGLPIVTEARWIDEKLSSNYGAEVHLAPNGIDKSIFREDGARVAEREPGRLRVLVEGALGVDFKNVARTIRLVRRSKAAEIWLLTNTPVAGYPGVDRVFSRVPVAETATVYRSCDVVVKLSYVEGMFGPPLEMFHCGGTAIVYDVSGYDEYIVDGRNALVVRTDDETGVVAALDRLGSEPALLAGLTASARATAVAWPDWPAASSRFLECLEKIVSGPAPHDATEHATLHAGIDARMQRYVARETAALPAGRVRKLYEAVRTRVARTYKTSRFDKPLLVLWWAHVDSRFRKTRSDGW